MANTRTYNVQAAVFNGVSLGGTTSLTPEQGFDIESSGYIDGKQGGSHGTARSGKFVRGSISSEDVSKAILLLVASPSNATFFEAESGTATYLKRTLKAPVFHGLSLSAQTGGRSSFTAPFECRWGSGDDFEDVDAPLANQSAPTIVVPPAYAEPTAAVYDPDGTPVTIGHIQSFSLNVSGELLRDSDPGEVGRDAVEFTPREVRFSCGFRDHTVGGMPVRQRTQDLVAATPLLPLRITLRKTGSVGADLYVILNNANNMVCRGTHGRDWAGFTLEGKCDWVDAAGAFYSLNPADAPTTPTLIDIKAVPAPP